jgi:hypothetical protein
MASTMNFFRFQFIHPLIRPVMDKKHERPRVGAFTRPIISAPSRLAGNQ